jgi:Rps23 Pro-64 3,4-dihydroxylase Tpa1-like proline 4-hydroxylase
MREQLTAHIVERIRRESSALGEAFENPGRLPTRHAVIDDVLPPAVAEKIYRAFPPPEKMRLLTSFRERKYTSKSLDQMDPLIADITFALQSPPVIAEVGKVTGIRDMIGDPNLYAGGISAMTAGQFLNPHIDNSHDHERRRYRVLNLLYYLSPGWRAEFGGSLELWDSRVRERVEIASLFNRLVIMETHQRSWHSVNRVKSGSTRCCVSNYYFSPHPPGGEEVFHITFFQGRPEQPFLRFVSTVDGHLRTLLRKFIKEGFSKRDLYGGGRRGRK